MVMTLALRKKRSAPKRAIVRRRRLMRPNRPIGLRQPVHYFKRTAFYNGYITGSTLSDVGGALIGQLNQVPGYTEFTNLYDLYRIVAMKIRLSPRANSAEVGTNQGIVKVFSCIDYDGGTAPSVVADILQFQNLKVTKSTQDHVRYWKPKFNADTAAIVGTGNLNTTGWLDCDNATVAHHGMKFVIQQLPAGNQTWDIYVTYYLAFKNVR